MGYRRGRNSQAHVARRTRRGATEGRPTPNAWVYGTRRRERRRMARRIARVMTPTVTYPSLVGCRRPASQYATDPPVLSPLAMSQIRLFPRTSSFDRSRMSRHVNTASVACVTPIAASLRLLGFFCLLT